MKVLRLIFIGFLVITFLNSLITPAFSYTEVVKVLYEYGVRYYEEGRYIEALHEFKKVLLIKPGHKPAKEYIEKIKSKLEIAFLGKTEREQDISLQERAKLIEAIIIGEILEKKVVEVPKDTFLMPIREETYLSAHVSPIEPIQKEFPLERLYLDKEIIDAVSLPIEIEQGGSFIITGKNIRRFLVLKESIVDVERRYPDGIVLTAKNIGYTYVHIWDENGRWTLYFQGILPRPEGPSYAETLRREAQKASNFKLRYALNWYSYESGRDLHTLERTYYAYHHRLSLAGDTPYGNISAATSIRTLSETTDMTYLNVTLREGNIYGFKDFTIQGVDFGTGFSNLAYGGAALRGIMLNSPAFNEHIDYTVFWGREGGGRYGGLSPGLDKIQNSFLTGFDINYIPSERIDYGFTYLHGWGRDREDYLRNNSYDFNVNYHLSEDFDMGYEVGYDSENFANLVDMSYRRPNLKLTAELRETNKDYQTITGRGWRLGELGALFNMYYSGLPDTRVTQRFDIYRDRLFPNPEKEDRWNMEYDIDVNYIIDRNTSVRFDGNITNELGKSSPRKYRSLGVSFVKSFDFIKRVNTYVSYRNANNKNLTSPTLDYIKDTVNLGFRVNLIGRLYYYLNKEFTWLHERYTGDTFRPESLSMGLDWSSQISDTPYYATLRLSYREEEDDASSLSFISGEDYVEGYGELSYRPHTDLEMFLSSRMRKVWPDNPDTNNRLEFEVRAGMRYIFDTGLSWNPIGNIEGYVFNDLDMDGVRQIDESGEEGVKVYLGKDNVQMTDSNGYFTFKHIRAKEATVNIDTSTIPSGFVVTSDLTKKVKIMHKKTLQADFGVASRSEITGYVFIDEDNDNRLDADEEGVSGVHLILEDGTYTVTNGRGRYLFRKVEPGEHTISLDIDTLRVEFIPKVPLKQDLILYEGMSFRYNIPVRKNSKE